MASGGFLDFLSALGGVSTGYANGTQQRLADQRQAQQLALQTQQLKETTATRQAQQAATATNAANEMYRQFDSNLSDRVIPPTYEEAMSQLGPMADQLQVPRSSVDAYLAMRGIRPTSPVQQGPSSQAVQGSPDSSGDPTVATGNAFASMLANLRSQAPDAAAASQPGANVQPAGQSAPTTDGASAQGSSPTAAPAVAVSPNNQPGVPTGVDGLVQLYQTLDAQKAQAATVNGGSRRAVAAIQSQMDIIAGQIRTAQQEQQTRDKTSADAITATPLDQQGQAYRLQRSLNPGYGGPDPTATTGSLTLPIQNPTLAGLAGGPALVNGAPPAGYQVQTTKSFPVAGNNPKYPGLEAYPMGAKDAADVASAQATAAATGIDTQAKAEALWEKGADIPKIIMQSVNGKNVPVQNPAWVGFMNAYMTPGPNGKAPVDFYNPKTADGMTAFPSTPGLMAGSEIAANNSKTRQATDESLTMEQRLPYVAPTAGAELFGKQLDNQKTQALLPGEITLQGQAIDKGNQEITGTKPLTSTEYTQLEAQNNALRVGTKDSPGLITMQKQLLTLPVAIKSGLSRNAAGELLDNKGQVTTDPTQAAPASEAQLAGWKATRAAIPDMMSSKQDQLAENIRRLNLARSNQPTLTGDNAVQQIQGLVGNDFGTSGCVRGARAFAKAANLPFPSGDRVDKAQAQMTGLGYAVTNDPSAASFFIMPGSGGKNNPSKLHMGAIWSGGALQADTRGSTKMQRTEIPTGKGVVYYRYVGQPGPGMQPPPAVTTQQAPPGGTPPPLSNIATIKRIK